MPTPLEWHRRAADILLDERNKRYLGMTNRPTGSSGDLPATAAGRARSLVEEAEALGERMPRTPTARRLVDEFEDYGWVEDFLAIEAEAADLRVPQEAEGLADPSGPLDVQRLGKALMRTIGKPSDKAVAEVAAEYARLTAATSASSQEAEG